MFTVTILAIIILIACIHFKAKEWKQEESKCNSPKSKPEVLKPRNRWKAIKRKDITKTKYIKRFR